MSENIPTTEPSKIIAGDTLKWNRQDLSSHYPASLWTLTYALRGPEKIDITAVADGDFFSVVVAASVTADYKPGSYSWSAYVTSGIERYQIDKGTLEICPDLATMPGAYDGRSHAKKVLDSIEAVLENRATKDSEEIEIAGRKITRMPVEDLLKFRDQYKAEYENELTEEKIANGENTGNQVKARF